MQDNKIQQVRKLIHNQICGSIVSEINIEDFAGEIVEWSGGDILIVATLLVEAEIAWAELAITRAREKRG